MKGVKFYIYLIAWFGSVKFAIADSPVPGRLMSSAECLALGDTCLTHPSDIFTLYYNPSKLPAIKPNFNLLDLQADVNRGGFSVLRDKGGSLDKLKDKTRIAADYRDKLLGARMAAISGFVLPSFGFAGFVSGHAYMKNDTVNQYVGYQIQQNLGATGGFGVSMFRGIIKLGYSGTYLDRGEQTAILLPTDSVNTASNLKEGTGFSHTAGFSLNFPWTYLPSLSIVGRNVGWTTFSQGGGVWTHDSKGPPTAMKPSYDTEFGMFVKIGAYSSFKPTFGYRDVLDANEEPAAMKVSAGFDLDLYSTFSIRLGVLEGYPTGGFGLKLGSDRVEITTYSKEVGTGFRNSEDRRFLFSIRVGLP